MKYPSARVLPSAALLCLLLLAGCATIFSGTSDEIHFESEPPGAEIYVDGLQRGETPATIDIDRPGLGETTVTLRMEGYADRTFELEKEFTDVSVLNLTSPLGWAIDIATGAVTHYAREGYLIELDPETAVNLPLEELPQDASGAFVVPSMPGGQAARRGVVVEDRQNGVAYVFEKK